MAKVGIFIYMSFLGSQRISSLFYSSIIVVWYLLLALAVHGRELKLPPPPTADCSRDIASRGRVGDRVRLVCADSTVLTGEFVSANEAKLLLMISRDSLTTFDSTISIQRIREITLSRRSRDMRNAATIAGAGVGALLGVIIGGSAAPPPKYNWQQGTVESSKKKYQFVGGIVGGLVGGIGGRVLGAGLRSSITFLCF